MLRAGSATTKRWILIRQLIPAHTPEYMEAAGRAEENGTDIRYEMQALRDNPALSVRVGIEDEQEQHKAVAARWPHLYTTATDE
jgi:hypothetical protein